MSFEVLLEQLLNPLVTGTIHYGVASFGATLPRIVVQQAGGNETQFVDGTLVDKEQPRMQVACWAKSYGAAKALSEQVAQAISTAAAFQGTPLGAAVSDYEPDTKLYGFLQDFLITADR